jgi:hypothetical protein
VAAGDQEALRDLGVVHRRGGDHDGFGELDGAVDGVERGRAVLGAQRFETGAVGIAGADAGPAGEGRREAEVMPAEVADADHGDADRRGLAHGRAA